MKLDRMMYNDIISVTFENEMNRSIGTEVTDNLLFQNRELRPFDNLLFGYYFPFFITQEVKCNEADEIKSPKILNQVKGGGPGMCSTEHAKF